MYENYEKSFMEGNKFNLEAFRYLLEVDCANDCDTYELMKATDLNDTKSVDYTLFNMYSYLLKYEVEGDRSVFAFTNWLTEIGARSLTDYYAVKLIADLQEQEAC